MEKCLNQSVHSQSNLNEIFLIDLYSNDFRVQMQLYRLKRIFVQNSLFKQIYFWKTEFKLALYKAFKK